MGHVESYTALGGVGRSGIFPARWWKFLIVQWATWRVAATLCSTLWVAPPLHVRSSCLYYLLQWTPDHVPTIIQQPPMAPISLQWVKVAQSCPTLCDPMDISLQIKSKSWPTSPTWSGPWLPPWCPSCSHQLHLPRTSTQSPYEHFLCLELLMVVG